MSQENGNQDVDNEIKIAGNGGFSFRKIFYCVLDRILQNVAENSRDRRVFTDGKLVFFLAVQVSLKCTAFSEL